MKDAFLTISQRFLIDSKISEKPQTMSERDTSVDASRISWRIVTKTTGFPTLQRLNFLEHQHDSLPGSAGALISAAFHSPLQGIQYPSQSFAVNHAQSPDAATTHRPPRGSGLD